MELFGPPDVKKLKEKRDVNGLVRALGYRQDWAVRRDAAEALGEVGDARVVNALIAALKDNVDYFPDRTNKIRSAAVKALGRIGDVSAIPPLIAALKDPHFGGGGFSEALALIGSPAIPALVGLLKEGDRGMNQSLHEVAVRALGLIGAPAVEPLIALLKSSDKLPELYWTGNALAAIGKPAVAALVAALQEDNPYIREAAADALEKLGWQPGRDESGTIYPAVKHEWGKCVEIEQPAAGALIAILADLNPSVKAAAALALGRIGDALAVDPLIAVLGRDDKGLRLRTAELLVRLFHSGGLDEAARERILAMRETIQAPHTDHSTYKYTNPPPDWAGTTKIRITILASAWNSRCK
jgi:HEAT repeat protein